MDALSGRKHVSLNAVYSNGKSGQSVSACQKYSLDELQSIIDNPLSAISIMQNLGQASSQASQVSSALQPHSLMSASVQQLSCSPWGDVKGCTCSQQGHVAALPTECACTANRSLRVAGSAEHRPGRGLRTCAKKN